MKLCECGCGKPTNLSPRTDHNRGLVKGEPYRFIAGHYARVKPRPEFVDRLVGSIDFSQSDCWIWNGSLRKDGHAQIKVDGRRVEAHRAVYEHFIGPITDGFHLDHLCRNPPCVNPAHLEPVLPRENVLRGYGPTALNARKTHCLQGHAYDDANTYWWKGKRQCRKCVAARARRRRGLPALPEETP